MAKSTIEPFEKSFSILIQDLPPAIVSIMDELRSILKLTVPEAVEKVNLGWRSLNFSHSQVGYFCGLFPFRDRVDIVFEFGVLLADPDGFFDEHRKQVGFAHIHSMKDFRKVPFQHLLKEAIALPSDRATRLALVHASAKPIINANKSGR